MTRRREPLRERFMKYHEVDPETGCWEWTAHKDKHGYGSIRVTWESPDGKKRNLRAHRVAWELFVGPIPEGLTIDHLCRNPGCVNPTHLEPVTTQENTRRWRDHYRKTITHCPQGHEFTEENTAWVRDTDQRRCRQCGRDATSAWYEKTKPSDIGPKNRDKTHCKHGHEFTAENTDLQKDGRRRCYECKRIRQNKRYDQVVRPTTGVHNRDKTHCKHGHEFTEENTIRTHTGRACRECGRIASRAAYYRAKAGDSN